MKKYEEPAITEEVTELLDIIAISGSDESTSSGKSKSVFDLDWSDVK